MARRKKKSVSQKIVGVATTGMPSPVRKLLGLKIVAGLIVLAVPVLFATGMLKVEWQNGRPKFSFNKERTAEIRENAADKAHDIREARSPDSSRHGLLGPREDVLGKEDGEDKKPLSGIGDLFKR